MFKAGHSSLPGQSALTNQVLKKESLLLIFGWNFLVTHINQSKKTPGFSSIFKKQLGIVILQCLKAHSKV